MKVKELIELLGKYDGEMEVYVDDSDYSAEPLTTSCIIKWGECLLFFHSLVD